MEISASRAATDVRHRIAVPNSTPRSIKLVGIGEGGAKMAAKVAEHRLRNVEIITSAVSRAEALQGANMVFLVATSGDAISVAPVISGIARSIGVLVTGIMIQKEIPDGAAAESRLKILRAAADMLVITSDESYLIEMLDALGA